MQTKDESLGRTGLSIKERDLLTSNAFDRSEFLVRSSIMNLCRALVGSALFLTSISLADTVTSRPIGDATITEKTPDDPDGSTSPITAGTTGPAAGFKSSRGLLRFSLSNSIPSDAIITSAALTVKVIQAPPMPAPSTFDLRKLLRAWNESSTWNTRLQPSSPWSASGASAPVDFSSIVTQTNSIPGTGTYTFISNSNMVADVQSWVLNPGSNFGWILISESQGVAFTERQFASREDMPNAPALVVQFTVPAKPPVLTLLPRAGNLFKFSFDVESNRTYAVEFCGSLIATNWSVLTNISSQPVSVNIVVSDSITQSNRFYRARTP